MSNSDWSIRHQHQNAGWQKANADDAAAANKDATDRSKSMTLQQVGAKMISEGRTHADLTVEDLKLLDPMTLPPKLRVKVQPEHPLYARESASYGKKQPSELEKTTAVRRARRQFCLVSLR